MPAESRRASDKILMEMHGNIKTLVALRETDVKARDDMKDRLDNHGKRISLTEGALKGIDGTIKGIKMSGGVITLLLTGLLGYLGLKK